MARVFACRAALEGDRDPHRDWAQGFDSWSADDKQKPQAGCPKPKFGPYGFERRPFCGLAYRVVWPSGYSSIRSATSHILTRIENCTASVRQYDDRGEGPTAVSCMAIMAR